MFKYLMGLLKNIFNKGISIFALVDLNSHVDKNSKVHRGVKIFRSNVDSFSYVGSGTSIIYTDIGKFCSIASNCIIGMGHHDLEKLSTSPIFVSRKNGTGHTWTTLNNTIEYRPVLIGNDVWIGINSIILGGVTIGDGAVIGAGSIVTKDIPSYAIAVGSPAKIIKYRFDDDIIRKLKELNWWEMPEWKIKQKIHLFQKGEICIEDLNAFEKD